MNKKILILVNHDLVIYNFRKELVQALIKDGYEVIVSSPNGKRIPELVNMGCTYVELKNMNRHGKNPFKELNLLNEYFKLIKDIKPMCVLTYTIKPNVFGAIAARKYNIPCLPNITGLGSAVEKKSILQLITVNMYKFAFKKVNTVFFQNEENLQFFKSKNLISNNAILLPGSGVNLEEFSYLDYPDEKKVKFVFISRVMKEKGIDLYLEAAKQIKIKYPFTEFHVCGFCEEDYEQILGQYENNSIIYYHGMVDDIKKILKDIHCTVHPTYYPEGLSNVLLESSACGRPIITTNRSGCREVVRVNENGFLVNQNDIKDLIEKIDKFIQLSFLEKKEMGYQGRKMVERYFDRKIVIDSYLNEISRIKEVRNER